VARIKQTGIDYVTLDLEGYRKGSMDIHVKK
jgi:PP-loop superfamily ATP-utilizing enzyme